MISVKLTGFKELQKTFGISDDLIEKHANEAIKNSVNKISYDAKSKAPMDTGNLINSIQVRLGKLRGEVFVGEKHGIFIEKGTRPHFPPVAPLERWALRKIGKSGLGFPIALKISKEGTKAQPFFYNSINMGYIDSQMYKALANLLSELKK